jgi:hypothetical protein
VRESRGFPTGGQPRSSGTAFVGGNLLFDQTGSMEGTWCVEREYSTLFLFY